MYLDLFEEDPEKNRRRNTMIFIVCVLLLASIIKCAGQITRTHPYKDFKHISRITTTESLMFYVDYMGGKDTIFTNITVDSLMELTYDTKIFVWFPKGLDIKTTELEIVFEKDDIEQLKSGTIVSDTGILDGRGYVEYRVTNEQGIKLRDKKYEYFNFIINDNNIPFMYSGDYFASFFKNL